MGSFIGLLLISILVIIMIVSSLCLTWLMGDGKKWRTLATEKEILTLRTYLGVLGNDLSMIYHPLTTHADVWVMKEYGVKESWTKMFNFKCVGYSFFGPHFCMSSEGEILFKNGSNIIICNPKDDSMRFQEVTNCGQLVDAKLYIESLVWPFVVEHTRNATTSKATHN